MKVKDIMTKYVKYVKVGTSINEALELMRTNDIGILPVLDGTKLIGIITDKDIIKNELEIDDEKQEEYFSKDVITIMHKDIITINENTLEKDVFKIMKEKKIRRLPVTDDFNNLTGIISLNDLDAERMKIM